MTIVVAPKARNDLREAYEYIHRDNPEAADRVLAHIVELSECWHLVRWREKRYCSEMAGDFTLGLSLPIASTIVKVAKCFRWFVSITKRVARSSSRLEAGLREGALMKNKGSVKAEMMRMIKALPDDLTWEDLQYHIYVRQKLERAEEDIAAGRVLSQKEVKKRIRTMVNTLRQRGSSRS